MAPERDLTLMIAHDNWMERIDLRANQPFPAATFGIDLNKGDVKDYPLDRYSAGLRVVCFDAASLAAGAAKPLPARVTVWEGLLGFHVETSEQPGGRPGEVRLGFQVRRTGAFAFFALAAYAAMLVLACGALTIGVLVFAGVRRSEVAQVGATGAITFALPVLRNACRAHRPSACMRTCSSFFGRSLLAVIALGMVVAVGRATVRALERGSGASAHAERGTRTRPTPSPGAAGAVQAYGARAIGSPSTNCQSGLARASARPLLRPPSGFNRPRPWRRETSPQGCHLRRSCLAGGQALALQKYLWNRNRCVLPRRLAWAYAA